MLGPMEDDADARHLDEQLDEALDETFPASDPVAPPSTWTPPPQDGD